MFLSPCDDSPPYSSYPNPILYEKGFGYFFVYRRFAFAPATNTPVGCLSNRTVCVSRWRGLAPTSSCGGTTRNGKQAKAGYHHGGGTLTFALHPLYCTFRVNRGVRPYMAGTHVRRKKGRFLHIGIFFRLSVWYTRFSLTNRNLQDGETYGRIDTKMFMGNYRLI